MPLSGRQLHGILLHFAFPSGALGLTSRLRRADGSGDFSLPRRTTANDVAAALISILVVAAIAFWLIWRLVRYATDQVSRMHGTVTDSSSDDSG